MTITTEQANALAVKNEWPFESTMRLKNDTAAALRSLAAERDAANAARIAAQEENATLKERIATADRDKAIAVGNANAVLRQARAEIMRQARCANIDRGDNPVIIAIDNHLGDAA